MPAGGPYKLTVSGKNTLTVQNVLLGEVWICIGQSNMQLAVNASQFGGQDIPKAADPQLRLAGGLMVYRFQSDITSPGPNARRGT
jgi:sialate O-acetylesterase